jgi:hypothetical protein
VPSPFLIAYFDNFEVPALQHPTAAFVFFVVPLLTVLTLAFFGAAFLPAAFFVVAILPLPPPKN